MAKLTIKQIAQKYNHSEVYVRRSILKGNLKSTKEKIAKDTYRHLIDENDYKIWRASTITRSKRTDNRNKYVIYLSPAEHKSLAKLLKSELPALESLLSRANQKSS